MSMQSVPKRGRGVGGQLRAILKSLAEGLCPKIRMPGCKAVDKVSCHVVRRITDCTKVKAPYPSFSECSRSALRKPRGIECNCLAIPSACDLIREAQKNEGNPRKGNCGGSRG